MFRIYYFFVDLHFAISQNFCTFIILIIYRYPYFSMTRGYGRHKPIFTDGDCSFTRTLPIKCIAYGIVGHDGGYELGCITNLE